MDNTFEKIESTSSEENDSSSSEESLDDINESTVFMNLENKKQYEKNRNFLFTKDIIRKHIVCDSHNYHQDSSFNSSNYIIDFDYNNNSITTNYDIYHNVIGFRLIKASIRHSPYNVNSTNNIIKYTRSGTEYTVTINPGLYTLSELANVFQTTSASNNAQYTTYTDSGGTFTVTFLDSNSTSSTVNKGLVFKIQHSASDYTINWNRDNITRGAAKLLGFIPGDITSSSNIVHSNKIPDLSSHYVDLVIPEIPSITCKRNSNGKDIIERIQLDSNHGEYIHHDIESHDFQSTQYFLPISLSRLTIQLYSENNEFYSCNNSDNSFEFEITIVANKNLLK
jgi:hypothetical protein